MQFSEKNIQILKELFTWEDVGKMDLSTIISLVKLMDENIEGSSIDFKQPWMDYRNITVFSEDKPVFYIKRLWESGSVKEALGLYLANLIDSELCPIKFILGTYRSRFLNKKISFIMVSWVAGKPISPEDALQHPIHMGQQYELGRWLCLYDCRPRHYIHQANGKIARIDYGLVFSKLHKSYEGFADIWPIKMMGHKNYFKGLNEVAQKIKTGFQIQEKKIMHAIDVFAKLELDDLIGFRGRVVRHDILEYWIAEDFINAQLHFKKPKNPKKL